MRPIVAIFGALFAGLAVDAMYSGAHAADPYRWCAEYGLRGGGATNCYFMTLGQCRAAVSGVGGFCRPNPFYTGPASKPRRTRRS
ncbi:MAG TPA: DUF3551 domain-containing protein [Xanthobacteraceae bacterium]|jgi:hypothetical protein|nr:DUF3551 domain-containing protein [Xanthobacteraceae bacterium]